jgi:protein TonB
VITRAGIIYLASFAAHGALALGIVSLKGPKKFEDVSISMVETKKKEKEKPKVDVPPPPPPPVAKDAAKTKAAPVAKAPPAPVAAAPAAAEPVAAPDFGLSLGGGSGGSLAVRAASAPAPAASAAPAPVHKVLAAAPAATAKCDEPMKKPRPTSISQPAYTPEARSANIAGKVRVEITVDDTGHVTKVRVLEGLGYGLDEAAIASARAATFEPGTLCGKATTATFTVAMRFTL